jgi:hypothetical protein
MGLGMDVLVSTFGSPLGCAEVKCASRSKLDEFVRNESGELLVAAISTRAGEFGVIGDCGLGLRH